MDRISYRYATPEDLDFLFALRKDSMTPHIESVGLVQDDDEHLNRILYRFEVAKIILLNGMDIGLLKVVEEGEAWDLVQIQLDSHYRSTGIGAKVLGEVLVRARERGVKVKLSVFLHNPAKKLYERLGFKTYQQTDTTFEMQFDGSQT